MAKDYVSLAIDTGKQQNADLVVAVVRKGHAEGGIPWMAILDGNGRQLITSDGPKGNIGFPYEPEEIAWFAEMLQKTRGKLTDEELAKLRKANDAFAERVRKSRK